MIVLSTEEEERVMDDISVGYDKIEYDTDTDMDTILFPSMTAYYLH